MEMPETQAQEKPSLVVSFLIVAAWGILCGVFLWFITWGYRPQLFPLSWEKAQWIAVHSESPMGIFRQELYIPEKVLHAWVQIAAPDNFSFYLNGHLIDIQENISVHCARVYSLTNLLKPGKNVLALSVDRSSYPGVTKLALKGAYLDYEAKPHFFVTGSGWKVSDHERRTGKLQWYDVAYDASGWSNAQLLGTVRPQEVYPVEHNPQSTIALPKGKWIWHPNIRAQRATFQRSLTIGHKVIDAWISIASASPNYKLTVNGYAVASYQGAEETPTLRTYDVAPLFHQGENIISIGVEGENFLPGLFIDGAVSCEKDEAFPLSSDSQWQVRSTSGTLSSEASSDDKKWRPAAVLASYQSFAKAPCAQKWEAITWPNFLTVKTTVLISLCLFVTVMMAVVFWMVMGLGEKVFSTIPLRSALRLYSLPFLPTIGFLISLLILQYDVRWQPNVGFHKDYLWVAFGMTALMQLLMWIEQRIRQLLRKPNAIASPPVRGPFLGGRRAWTSYLSVAVVLGFTAIGFSLRFQSLTTESLTPDEALVVQGSQGTLERGYPVVRVGSMEKMVTTYELLHYPVALCMWLLGLSDFSLRLPSLLYGVLTIPLLYWVGMHYLNKRVGVIAAALYAFAPWSIIWSQNCRYQQGVALFALLCTYLFFRGLEQKTFPPRYIYGASVFFVVTYLFWEGTGFMLPTLMIALVAMKGRDFSWLKDKHLWIGSTAVGLVVFFQMANRFLQADRYIVVGTGLMGATLSLNFLDPLYNPGFYVDHFFLLENNTICSLIMLLGLPLIFYHRALRYLYILITSLFLMETNLFPNQSTRYLFYLQPLLMLAAVGVSVCFFDSVCTLRGSRKNWVGTAIIGALGLFIPAFLWATSNDTVLRLYRLSDTKIVPLDEVRLNVYGTDFRSTIDFVTKNLRPGDVVCTVMPHVCEYYARHSKLFKDDYYLESYPDRQVFYDTGENPQVRYLSKYVGNPVIRTVTELQDAFNKSQRIWIVAAPYGTFLSLNDEHTVNYIREYSDVVYETYKSKVFLWEKKFDYRLSRGEETGDEDEKDRHIHRISNLDRG